MPILKAAKGTAMLKNCCNLSHNRGGTARRRGCKMQGPEEKKAKKKGGGEGRLSPKPRERKKENIHFERG